MGFLSSDRGTGQGELTGTCLSSAVGPAYRFSMRTAWSTIGLTVVMGIALALAAATPPTPIPDTGTSPGPAFVGTAGRGRHVRARRVPRHPFMAANGRSNIHDDAYITDTYRVRRQIDRSIHLVSA